MFKNHPAPQARTKNIVVRELENEILVYDLTENKAFCLNPTSALIWQACDGERSIEEIADLVGEKLKAPVSEEIIRLALYQLGKDRLLEENFESFSIFPGGANRRELIRKIGAGSLVALPIISSLVAPTAAQIGSATCGGACQCPNATTNFCSPASGPNCNNLSPQTGTASTSCRCRGPFGAPGSGTTSGQKTGSCSV